MKYLVWMGALACASMFAACSDDDEGGDDGVPDDGGGNVAVLERRMAKIVTSDRNGVTDTETFIYGAGGELAQIVTVGDNSQIIDITHTDDRIVMSYSENSNQPVFYTHTLSLSDGRATGATGDYASAMEEDMVIRYAYEGGYLCRDEWESGEGEAQSGDTLYLESADGNLTRIRWEGGSETTVESGTVANNANIDLLAYVVLYDFLDAEPFYFGVGGERFKNMPTKITDRDWDEEAEAMVVTYEAEYSYEVDDEGYVTRITCTEDEGGWPYTYWYDITYEE